MVSLKQSWHICLKKYSDTDFTDGQYINMLKEW